MLQIMKEPLTSLFKGEALLKALMQSAGDVFLVTDAKFQINYTNEAIIKLLGYYPDELAGRTGFELIHPEDKESFAGWLALLMEKPNAVNAIDLRVKNSIGSWILVEAHGKNFLQEPGVESLIITCRESQSKKIADQALVQAEQRLTLLLNNTKESFIILNSRLRVMAYNAAAQEHSPYFFRQELQSGLSFMELVPEAEAEKCLSLLEKVADGAEQQKETSFTDAAGKVHIYHHTFRSLDLGSEGKGVFVTSTDITEKHAAENALKQSEERFKSIIEYSFDAVVIIDGDGTINYASPSITNLIGFAPEELVGRNGFEFIYADDIAEVQAKLASIVNNEEETYADYRSITKDEGLKWLEAKGKNMYGNKLINGILVSLRDISQRKAMIEEQTALTNELSKYNKDLQQFSFITSHNLRAPVANILGLLSLYNKENIADSFNLEVIAKIDECTQQLNETLTDLINVLVIRSSNVDVEFIRFDEMTKLVRKSVDGLLDEIGGVIETNFSEVEGTDYNKVHLESIFLNLVSNAIKYSSPERKLKVSITSEKTNEGIRLLFADNGIGIDLNRYGDRIFGLYQRFHAGKQGKGLGLYMVKSQILSSGGSIKVQSEPGVGTTFFVHLKSKATRE